MSKDISPNKLNQRDRRRMENVRDRLRSQNVGEAVINCPAMSRSVPYRVQRSDALEQTLETTRKAMNRFQVASATSGGR